MGSLPPNSSWRGEGIAQTIENIVRNISPERKIEIVVSSKHAEMLVGLEKSNPNISVLTLGFGVSLLKNDRICITK